MKVPHADSDDQIQMLLELGLTQHVCDFWMVSIQQDGTKKTVIHCSVLKHEPVETTLTHLMSTF